MKTARIVTLLLLTAIATDAWCDNTLTCHTTIIPARGAPITGSKAMEFTSFFDFSIDPALGTNEGWMFQNLCLSRKEIPRSRLKGYLCLLVFSSGPKDGGQNLYINLLRAPGRSAQQLVPSGVGDPSAMITLPFPSGSFEVEMTALAEGIRSVKLSCQ
jgi:hypothetical protein